MLIEHALIEQLLRCRRAGCFELNLAKMLEALLAASAEPVESTATAVVATSSSLMVCLHFGFVQCDANSPINEPTCFTQDRVRLGPV